MTEKIDHRRATSETFESIYARLARVPIEKLPKPPRSWTDALIDWGRPVQGQTSAEVGCGSGFMSARLCDYGVAVTLVDISPSALAVAKRVFDHLGKACTLRQEDLFHLDGSVQYDLVWNAGVMEHFTGEERRKGIEAMGRCVCLGGRMIVMVPSARGLFYRWGKRRLEARNRWPYGIEYPIRTLVDCVPPGFTLIAEDQIGVWSQADRALGCPKWVKPLIRALAFGNDRNRFWKHLVGGYLLVSVFEKRSE